MRLVVSLMLGLVLGTSVGCRSGSAEPPPDADRQAIAPIAAQGSGGDDGAMPDRRHRKAQRVARSAVLRGARGTYSGEPRTADGRIDIERLAGELQAVRANTYNFLIKRGAHDWDDLRAFLPLARRHGIHVWVTITCPSKKSKMSQPFGHDYARWAEEIATLSLREPSLVAWGMDDFSYNRELFSRKKTKRILAAARRINPNLAFVPTVYYKHAVRHGYAGQYKGLLDGVLFPYRAESSGRGNLADAQWVQGEIGALRALFGKRTPIILDVYASRHSKMGESTPEYVEQVMQSGRQHADGLMVFRHQEPGSAKWSIVSTSFHE
jgi:hypothetical protein